MVQTALLGPGLTKDLFVLGPGFSMGFRSGAFGGLRILIYFLHADERK